MTVRILQGDCIDRMRELPEAAVDAVVCDPPYAIGFMGKGWDSFAGTRADGSRGGDGAKGILPGYGRGGTSEDRFAYRQKEARAFQDWCEQWASEALRVLKPGGHLLAFGGTRTYHRLAAGVEDAGFEIRDTIAWMYGSGFPKSLNVSAAIDKAAGAAREVVGEGEPFGRGSMRNRSRVENGYRPTELNPDGGTAQITAPATPEAQAWEGWGTALKPAHEPIVVARKPLSGTVAGNVLAYGTGALNIDACRIGTDERVQASASKGEPFGDGSYERGEGRRYSASSGRWPANVVLDVEAARMLDEQTGELGVSTGTRQSVHGYGMSMPADGQQVGFGDSGGASRFFLTVHSDPPSTLSACEPAPNVEPTSSPSERPPGTADDPAQGPLPPPSEVNDLLSGGSASSADEGSSTTSATDQDGSAPPSATTQHGPFRTRPASNADDPSLSTGDASAHTPAPTAPGSTASRVGQGSTGAHSEPTTNPDHAPTAAPTDSSDTTTSTSDPKTSCGCAPDATPVGIPIAAMGDGSDLTRWRYQAKSSSAERNAGLDGFEPRETRTYGDLGPDENARPNGQAAITRQNVHPTVKPVELMRWLIRLVVPPGGTCLDPFLGSGTTGCAAVLERVEFVGIERDAEYLPIAEARIAWWAQHPEGVELVKRLEAERERAAVVESGQDALF